MLMNHLLYGNLPNSKNNSGFTAIRTENFTDRWPVSESKSVRVPSESPVEGKLREADGSVTLNSTYEIHAIGYGIYTLIHSCEFKPTEQARPLGYMDAVYPAEGERFSLPGLLEFREPNFKSTRDWIGFAGDPYVSLPAEEWECGNPEKEITRPSAIPYTEDNNRNYALLARFWASCSSRMFKGTTETFTVCLTDSRQLSTVNQNAREFLLNAILPYLPEGVGKIVSMTSGVTIDSVGGDAFHNSGMCVVLPPSSRGGHMEHAPDFDFRPGKDDIYETTLETAMIGEMLAGNPPKYRKKAYEAWLEREKFVNGEADCTFMADYDICLFLYMLECMEKGMFRMDAERLPAFWTAICESFEGCGHLDFERTTEVLYDAEKRLADMILNAPAALAAITPEIMNFLWRKALIAKPDLAEKLYEILGRCASSTSFPKIMTEVGVEEDPEKKIRTASIVRAVFANLDTGKPIDPQMITQLMDRESQTVLNRVPEIEQALTDGLNGLNEKSDENYLVTLPLTVLLPGGDRSTLKALSCLIRHAENDHSASTELPVPEIVTAIKTSVEKYGTSNPELIPEITRWLAVSLPAQLQEEDSPANQNQKSPASGLDGLLQIADTVLTEKNQVLIQMLKTAGTDSVLLEPGQLCRMADHLLNERAADAPEVANQLNEYENQVREIALHYDRKMQISRLHGCRELLARLNVDLSGTLTEVMDSYTADAEMLNPEQSRMIIELWRERCDRESKETVRGSFKKYLNEVTTNSDDPLFYLKNPQEIDSIGPILQETGVDLSDTVCTILANAKGQGYFPDAAEIMQFWKAIIPKCNRMDLSKVSRAFMDYAQAVYNSDLEEHKPFQLWMWSVCDMSREYEIKLFADSFEMEQQELALRYICDLYADVDWCPDEETLRRMKEKFESSDNQIREKEEAILNNYDKALQGDRYQDAAGQLKELFGSLKKVSARVPNVQELYLTWLQEGFRNQIGKADNYDDCVEDVKRKLTNNGLDVSRFFSTETEDGVKQILRERYDSELTSVDLYRPETRTEDRFYRWRSEALKESFKGKYEWFIGECRTLHEFDRVQGVAKVMGVESECVSTAKGKAVSVAFRAGNSATANMNYPQSVNVINDYVRQLQNNASETKLVQYIVNEQMKVNADSFGKPSYQQIAQAIIRNIRVDQTGTSVNWHEFFLSLGLVKENEKISFDSADGKALRTGIYAVYRYTRQELAYICTDLKSSLLSDSRYASFAKAMVKAESEKKYKGPKLFKD